MTIEELKEEYEQKINKLSEEFNNKITELQEEESNKRWKPEHCAEYYFLTGSGDINYGTWINNNNVDEARYALGNCFKKVEEVEFAIEQLKVLAELREYANDKRDWGNYAHYPHYLIYYDVSCNEIAISGDYNYITSPFNIYFSSREQAQKAIAAIGEERFKKYYFCVEE